MNSPTADQEHLRLLTIFHYVVGGLTALFACLPLIHFGMGVFMIVSPHSFGNQSAQQPPAFVGWLIAAMGAFFFLCGQALAVCTILAGRFLQRRSRYLFVFVTACVECIFMPFGTVLGIFTILVLSRESVKRLFIHDVPAPIPT
jgi:hypothetical protein